MKDAVFAADGFEFAMVGRDERALHQLRYRLSDLDAHKNYRLYFVVSNGSPVEGLGFDIDEDGVVDKEGTGFQSDADITDPDAVAPSKIVLPDLPSTTPGKDIANPVFTFSHCEKAS